MEMRRMWAECRICLVILLICSGVSESQGEERDNCINQLSPCLGYLRGSNRERDSCCEPLKRVIKSYPECICKMISIEGTNAAERAGINVTQAQQLPAMCGQRVNPIGCLSGAANPNSSGNSVSNSFRCRRLINAVIAVSFLLIVIHII